MADDTLKGDEKTLADAKKVFDQCVEAEEDNREGFLEDLRFARLAEQWPEKIKTDREKEGRPCLTVNRMPAFIRQVVNDARQNKPSIKVHPVDDKADPATAEVMNGLIRNIEAQSNADVAYDTAIDSSVSGGIGYIRVDVDYAFDDTFDQDIKIERVINPLTVYGDPTSTAADSSDWNVAFVTEMLTEDEFEARFPDAEKVDWESDREDDDKEWFDGKTIRVAEYWTREEVKKTLVMLSDGQAMFEDVYIKDKDFFDVQGLTITDKREALSHEVVQRIMTADAVLETNDWPGKYIPIIPVYGEEVVIEGKRYFRSLIRDAKDSQTMYNFWRTATAELVALAPKTPFIGPVNAFNTDANKWATANHKSHPYIQYDGAIPPQRQAFAGPPAGALQEALNASDDMKSVMGIHDASLGARSNETSGVAIKARQREGDVSTFHFIDNMSRAIRHTGLILVDLIPKVYSQPRVLRILGEDDTPQNVPVNQNVPTGQMGEDGEPEHRMFDLTTGRYDVVVRAGPSFTTRREEAAVQMTDLIRAFPDAAPLIGDLLAKNLDWPGADEIAERMKSLLPKGIEEGNPEADALKQQMQELASKMDDLMKDKSIEQRKVEIDFFKAQTDRMKAHAEIAKDKADIAKDVADMMTPPEPEPVNAAGGY